MSGEPADLAGVRRIVVITARPDDEVHAGGLIDEAMAQGIPIEVVAVAEELGGSTEQLSAHLVDRVGEGRSTLIVAAYPPDDKPEHGAVARAAATAARRTGADLWARRSTPPHDHVLTLSADCTDDALDRLHEGAADPWGVETRWYEQRKRDLVLAVLPRERFDAVIEVGCSTGALAEALASRSERVVAVDSSPAAVAAAPRRFATDDRVTVAELDLPT